MPASAITSIHVVAIGGAPFMRDFRDDRTLRIVRDFNGRWFLLRPVRRANSAAQMAQILKGKKMKGLLLFVVLFAASLVFLFAASAKAQCPNCKPPAFRVSPVSPRGAAIAKQRGQLAVRWLPGDFFRGRGVLVPVKPAR